MIREEIVAALVATKKWSSETARMAENANYQCEYCDGDLLSSVEMYQFQKDHIVPKRSGGRAERQNLAVSCWYCNYHLKRRWDPREAAGADATRDQLIAAVRAYVAKVRLARIADLDEARRIVGRNGS